MISELMRVAETAGLTGFESQRQRPIHWFIDLDADGRVVGFSPTTVKVQTNRGERKERRGKEFGVPANYHMQWKNDSVQSVCTNDSNWLPDFLSAPPNEIFPAGVNGDRIHLRRDVCRAVEEKGKKHPDKNRLYKLGLWRKMIARAQAENPQNPIIRAIALYVAGYKRFPERLKFLTLPLDASGKQREKLLEDFDDGKETISFRVCGRIATSDPALREWWSRQVKKQRDEVIQHLHTGHDAFTSGNGPITEYFPSVFGSVPFASFNKAPFVSYGLGSQTATFRLETAEKIAAGLNALLNDSRTSLKLGDETAVFWAVDRTSGKPQPVDFLQLLDQPDPLAVRDYLKSIWGSRSPELAQAEFYVAILLKGTGRFSVRSWHTDTLANADGHVRHYFAAIQIESEEATPILSEMASATITKTRKQKAKPTPATFNALFEAAWRGTALPYSLLATAICRQKIELAGGDPGDPDFRKRLQSRTALVQLYFALKNDGTTITQKTTMNAKESAILCGRLLAILDKIHDVAHEGRSASSPANRLYGAASATPALVFPKLCQLARYHLQKMDAGMARKLEFGVPKDRRDDGLHEDFDGLAAIVATLKEAADGNFPRLLSLEDQGRFALGFYYERCRKWPNYAQSNSDKTSNE
jgi:CRISPR-associated protein Csd1